MDAFVVDVNVAIVANGKASNADSQCELDCIQKLVHIQKNLVVIDDDDLILKEYRRNLAMSGQPGVGDEFMYWLFQNQCKSSKCERVRITDDSDRVFEEFPTDPRLADFDRSDRKYVAVALASKHRPVIVNAVDSDWLHHEAPLKDCGVHIDQLCPHCLKGDNRN